MTLPTSLRFSTREVADLFGVEPDTARYHVRVSGHFRGIFPDIGADGSYQWPRGAVLAALPGAELTEGEASTWEALTAYFGPIKVTPSERAELLSFFYSLPHARRHDAPRLFAHLDLVRRGLSAINRCELWGRRNLGDHHTELSANSQRQLAERLQQIIDLAARIQRELLASAAKKELAT